MVKERRSEKELRQMMLAAARKHGAAKRGFNMDDDKQLLDGDELPRISTGNAGLDDILGGGIDPERMYPSKDNQVRERQP